MKGIRVALAAGAAALGIPYATAQHAASPEDQRVASYLKFRRLDADRDGFLSRREIRRLPGYAQAFDQADANRDARLSPAEFAQAEHLHRRMQAAASVDDGYITAQIKSAFAKQWRTLDLGVDTFRGHVLLSGFIESETQRRTAMRLAASVDGVVAVKDGLVVKSW